MVLRNPPEIRFRLSLNGSLGEATTTKLLSYIIEISTAGRVGHQSQFRIRKLIWDAANFPTPLPHDVSLAGKILDIRNQL